MAQDSPWTTAAWTPCPLDREEVGGRRRSPEGDPPVSSRHLPGGRAATAPSGLVIAPLPLDTLAALLLILLVFVILVVILADRPNADSPGGLGDPFEVIPSRDAGTNHDS